FDADNVAWAGAAIGVDEGARDEGRLLGVGAARFIPLSGHAACPVVPCAKSDVLLRIFAAQFPRSAVGPRAAPSSARPDTRARKHGAHRDRWSGRRWRATCRTLANPRLADQDQERSESLLRDRLFLQ